jgi:hypothetical protein
MVSDVDDWTTGVCTGRLQGLRHFELFHISFWLSLAIDGSHELCSEFVAAGV